MQLVAGIKPTYYWSEQFIQTNKTKRGGTKKVT
jgi:hypothetical protein